MADAKTNIRRWFDEIWNHGNLDVVDDLMRADSVVDVGLPVSEVRGPQQFRAFAQTLRAALSDVAFEIHEVLGEARLSALRFTVSGTHSGPWLGLAPTHRRFTAGGMAIGEWDGDKLVRGWNTIDMLAVLTQLGATLAPPDR